MLRFMTACLSSCKIGMLAFLVLNEIEQLYAGMFICETLKIQIVSSLRKGYSARRFLFCQMLWSILEVFQLAIIFSFSLQIFLLSTLILIYHICILSAQTM